MRTLCKASLVFLITDMYTKDPINNAIVLCDGKQLKYTRKKSGHYVFVDLYPKKYRIDVLCKGFVFRVLICFIVLASFYVYCRKAEKIKAPRLMGSLYHR